MVITSCPTRLRRKRGRSTRPGVGCASKLWEKLPDLLGLYINQGSAPAVPDQGQPNPEQAIEGSQHRSTPGRPCTVQLEYRFDRLLPAKLEQAYRERVFEELDLNGCRCVIMGACESGVVRADIGAEYIGLPSAMLSSGVRYIIGALWKINAMAAAILMDRFLERIRDERVNVPAALCQCQREVMAMKV
jgi:hypothetical protein